jgi:putrescine transport system permease protein|tara:strand:- start:352 stop:678 length:327 start_codon:yes stop_codon:yes gene_type:complete
LSSYDKNIEEAAQDLGTIPNMIFWKVTAPVILPAILSGWLLAFTLSLDDLVVASFTTGPGANTLPIVVFSKVRLGLSPEVNALSAIIMLIVILAAISIYLINRSNIKK